MVSTGILEYVRPLEVFKNNIGGNGIDLNPKIQSMISQKR